MARRKIIPSEYEEPPVPADIDPVILRAKHDWDERAKRDPLHWTVNAYPEGQWPFEEYMAGGENEIAANVDNLALPQTATVVEIGAGAGRCTTALAKRFHKVIGCELSPEMIKAAKKNLASVRRAATDRIQAQIDEIEKAKEAEGRNPYDLSADDPRVKALKAEIKKVDGWKVDFRELNGYNLNVVNTGIADLVFSCIVFQHIPSRPTQMDYMREVARILKPGGYFVISLYDDEKEYALLSGSWALRRAANDVMGWSELAKTELDRYETSMCTPIGFDNLSAVIDETGMQLLTVRGRHTQTMWVVGKKP